MPGGITSASGTQRIASYDADDLGAGLLAEGQLGRRLAADVRAQVVEDRLLAERPQDRELERLRDERETEVEVEDVRARQQPQRAPATASPAAGGSRRGGRATSRPPGAACSARRPRAGRRRRAARSACTFVHGTPAVLTGQWTTRSGRSAAAWSVFIVGSELAQTVTGARYRARLQGGRGLGTVLAGARTTSSSLPGSHSTWSK